MIMFVWNKYIEEFDYRFASLCRLNAFPNWFTFKTVRQKCLKSVKMKSWTLFERDWAKHLSNHKPGLPGVIRQGVCGVVMSMCFVCYSPRVLWPLWAGIYPWWTHISHHAKMLPLVRGWTDWWLTDWRTTF